MRKKKLEMGTQSFGEVRQGIGYMYLPGMRVLVGWKAHADIRGRGTCKGKGRKRGWRALHWVDTRQTLKSPVT